MDMSRTTTEIAETIAELLRQQIDVLRAARQGPVPEHDVAAYHARDLEIHYLFEHLDPESSEREHRLVHREREAA
jgi:hypothetical protein